jgi:hypothetical protein
VLCGEYLRDADLVGNFLGMAERSKHRVILNKMFRIAYVSTASAYFDEPEIRRLLKHSIEQNARSDITGILLHKDGQFMQLLEGDEEDVMATFNRISNDPRHHNIFVLIKQPVEQRHFPGWFMAFRDLDRLKRQGMIGYDEFFDTQLTGQEFATKPDRCEKLLLLFKKNFR